MEQTSKEAVSAMRFHHTMTVALLAVVAAVSSCAVTSSSQPASGSGESSSSSFRNIHVGRSKHMAKGRQSMFLARHLARRPSHEQQQSEAKMNNYSNLPAGGSIWPVSIFWAYVEIGTPPRSLPAAIDSGSGDLYILGEGCDGCTYAAPNQPYNPSKSNTSAKVPGPGFQGAYMTCDPTKPNKPCLISGPYYTDMASLAGYGPTRVAVGAITQQSSDFYQFSTINGVMGMIGNGYGNPYFELCIAHDGFCPEQVWAICLHEGTKSNGTLTIGGVDESLADGPITYVPSPNNTGYYGEHHVYVHNVTFGDKTVEAKQHAILDTGTNDILLPGLLFYEAKKQICGNGSIPASSSKTAQKEEPAHCSEFFDNTLECHSLTDDQISAYPNVTFQLDNNLILEITPREYLLKHSPAATSPDQYCLGLSSSAYFILGDTIMQNYYLVFKQQEVGWGRVNKKTCGSK